MRRCTRFGPSSSRSRRSRVCQQATPHPRHRAARACSKVAQVRSGPRRAGVLINRHLNRIGGRKVPPRRAESNRATAPSGGSGATRRTGANAHHQDAEACHQEVKPWRRCASSHHHCASSRSPGASLRHPGTTCRCRLTFSRRACASSNLALRVLAPFGGVLAPPLRFLLGNQRDSAP